MSNGPVSRYTAGIACLVLFLVVYQVCSRSRASEPKADPPSTSAVLGEWDVVNFNGYAPSRRTEDATRAAYADFSPGGVSLHLQCNYTARAGTIEGGRFIAKPAPLSMQTLIGCGPEAGRRDAEYFSFFERGPIISRIGAHRLVLTADGKTLELERPSIRRLAFVPGRDQLIGKWEMAQITRYLPTGGVASAGIAEAAGHLVITDQEIRHTTCPQFRLSYRMSEDGHLMSTGRDEAKKFSECEGLHAEASSARFPNVEDAIRLFFTRPAVEVTGSDLLLSTSDYGLVLRRVE